MLDGESTPVFYRDYGTARTTWWTPILPGSYTVKVLVLDNGVDVPRTASMTYIVNPVLTGVTLSMVSPPGSPTAVGVPLNLLAEAQGGGTVEYQYLWNFSLTTRASATWTKLTYGLGRGFTHTPTQVGYYTFRVYARERGSGVTTFQAASTDLKVQVKAPITGYGIQITPNGSGQFTIGVTNVVGAGGNPQWKYWAKRSGGSYALLQDYTANTTLSKWSPTPGTYTVMVYMKEAGSKATAYDLSWTTPYVVP
jgi:hypothetical protein